MQVFISTEKSDQPERLRPNHKIREGKEYDLIIRPDQGGEIDLSELENSRLKRLKIIEKRPKVPGSKEERYTINFRNFVGRAEILGRSILVESEKLEADGFEKMLAQITEMVASLPFDFNSPTYETFEMAAEMPRTVLYHCFNYLRYIMREADNPYRLSSCVLTVLLSMKRELETRTVTENITSGKMDPSTIDTLAQTPSDLKQIPPGSPAYSLPLAKRLTSNSGKRYIPIQVQTQKNFTTVDTPENRFVKYFLERCNDIVLHFRDIITAENNQYLDPTLREDCEKMSRKLSYYLSFPVLRDVGPMKILPMGSTTLQKRGGYREILRYFSKMNLGAKFPVSDKDLKSIIEDKNIAKLYEYWCFFKVAGIIKTLLIGGQETAFEEITEKGVHVRQGPVIKWTMNENRLELAYNRHFPTKTRKQSYSLGLRPDIALTINSSTYLFDAKFKIVTLEKQVDQQDFEEIEKEEDTSSKFVNGDIYKMHTYRDAIQGVKAAFVLYPGYQEDFTFFEAQGKTPTERTRIKDMDSVSGVGAVALRPPKLGETTLENLITRILPSV